MVSDSLTENFILQRGCVGDKDLIFFLTYNADAALQKVPNGQLFFLQDGNEWSFQDVAWTGISLTASVHPDLVCYLLGRDGEVLVGNNTGFYEEKINDNGANPENRGPMQCIRLIENTPIAVGMGRQVYKRIGQNHWEKFENGIDSPPPPPSIVGLNAIAGGSMDAIYSVGWAGEIWYYNGQNWQKLDSPTNLILHDVIAMSDNRFWACGQNGLLLNGTPKHINLVEYDGPVTTWRSMSWFLGRLFIADGQNLYVLEQEDDGNSMLKIDVGDNESLPVLCLHSSEDLLLAVTAENAYVTEDGVQWKALPV